MPLRQAAAIRHIHFEDLGSFGPELEQAGYALRYHDAGSSDLDVEELAGADLLIVLGGPIGAYEEDAYPFLTAELAAIERRLARGAPLVGICLGAQLIARALGSRVYPGSGKEIGWSGLDLTGDGMAGPLRHLGGIDVLHWHGDTFDLPDGCVRLAGTAAYENQAFARGPGLLALQFHVEATGRGFERWLIGHACELAGAGLDPRALRADAAQAAPALEKAAPAVLREWLQGFD